MLLILGGLPASGKSTIAKGVALELNAVHIRVDTIEQTLRDVGFTSVHSEGYELAYSIAADNVALGLTVVADSVNSIRVTRDAWRAGGETAGVTVLEVEIICSDQNEHKQRVETRVPDIQSKARLTWNDVITRAYEPWLQVDALIDTAGESLEQSIEKTLSFIKSHS